MIIEQSGVWARSNAIAYSTGETHNYDLSFLKTYMRRMQSPVISEVLFHFTGTGTVTGVTATLLGEDSYNLISSLNISDRGGPLFNQISGKELRVIEAMERGDRFGPQQATVASGATSTTYDVYIRAIFDTSQRGFRGADTRLPLLHLVEGGDVQVTFGSPAGGTMPSSNYNCTMYARVIDERERELKSRMEWRSTAISATEDDYICGGSLRAAIITSNLGSTAGYTTLATTTTIDSQTLQFPAAIDTELLRQAYRAETIAPYSDDEFLASTPYALPLFTPKHDQRIGQLPDIDSLHVRGLASVPTSGRMLTCVIKDRVGSLAAEWAGFASVADYVAAVANSGFVTGKGRSSSSVSSWDPKLVRRLPLRIRPGA